MFFFILLFLSIKHELLTTLCQLEKLISEYLIISNELFMVAQYRRK